MLFDEKEITAYTAESFEKFFDKVMICMTVNYSGNAVTLADNVNKNLEFLRPRNR